MTKLFFDHLLDLDEVEREVKKTAKTIEQREELWQLVDEMVHHRVMGCIFDNLPKPKHQEFLDKFNLTPHDEGLIDYLKKEIGKNVDEIIKTEVGSLSMELLDSLRGKESLSAQSEPESRKR